MNGDRLDAISPPAELLKELTERLEKVLASRRWTIGDSIAGATDRLMRRPRRPTAADTIRRVTADFATWVSAVPNEGTPDLAAEQLRRLSEWMASLDEAFHGLLRSRRWRLGSLVVDIVRILLLRPSRPTSVRAIEDLLDRCRRFREGGEETPYVPALSLADLYYHLGVVREKAGKWAAAAEAYEEALKLAEARPALFFRLGRVRAHQKRWVDAVRAYQEAVRQSPKKANWYFHLAEAYERCDRFLEADRAYEQAIDLEPARPEYYCGRARVNAKCRQWSSASALYEAAIRLEPSFSAAYFGLGQLREQQRAESPLYSAHSGLRLCMQGDWRAAADAYKQAIAVDPTVAEYHFRLGHVCEQMRDFQGAMKAFEEAVRLKPGKEEWLYRLGRAREQILDLDGALNAYNALLRANPRHAKARSRMYTIQVKLARWGEAERYAVEGRRITDGQPRVFSLGSENTLRQLRSLLASAELVWTQRDVADLLSHSEGRQLTDALPANWWFALHWRLLNIGWYSLAYRVKDIAARVLLSDRDGKAPPSLARFLAIGKALVQLERREEADQHLSALAASGVADEELEVAVTRLLADIDAFYGDFARLRSGLGLHDGVNTPEADEAFAELLRGRSIAIVGPVENGLRNGDEIDSFDVVIRTNFLPASTDRERAESFGTRTDVSYFNGVASQMLTGEIEAAVASGALRMIVLRPFNYVLDRSMIKRPGDLRYNPSESTVLLRAKSFGVQRIMHDVLRYSPARVKVFNIDFFLSRNAYNKGYKARELLADSDPFYLGSGHDYRGDFIFTKRLRDVGLVSCDDEVNRLLDLSPADYLRRLDRDEDLSGARSPSDIDERRGSAFTSPSH